MWKRSIALGSAAVVACAALVACSPDDEAPGGNNGADGGPMSLTVYYGTPRDIIEPLFNGFRAAHPEVEVEEFRQPTEELMSTLQLEVQAGNNRADAVISVAAQLTALQDSHEAFRPYESADAGELLESLADPSFVINPFGSNKYVIAFNSDVVSPDEAPRSYADLLDPRWTDQISIGDPDNSASIHTFIWHITQHLSEQGAPYGWEYFEALGQLNPRLESSHGTIRDLVLSGERPIGLLLTEHIPALDADPSGDWIWPEETMPAETLSVAILENAQNSAAAELFVDYLHSIEGQELIGSTMGLVPVREDVDFEFADGTTLSDHDVVGVDSLFVSQNRQQQADEFHSRMGTR